MYGDETKNFNLKLSEILDEKIALYHKLNGELILMYGDETKNFNLKLSEIIFEDIDDEIFKCDGILGELVEKQEVVKLIKKALTHEEDKGKPPAAKKPNNIFKENRRGFSSRSFNGGTTTPKGGGGLSSFAGSVSTSTREAGGRSTRNSGRDKDSERNHPASRVDSQPSPKPASVKAQVDPSLKDKGRTATEQPNNIFKGVRRDQWGLSSFAPDKGYRPKSTLRTKYKIFNPLKQLVGEHRESLVSDALKELEPAKHPEILVPDAVKRPVRRQKPASDIFSKSFFHLISSNKRLTSYIDTSEKKLRQPKGRGYIGDRKYFPAVSTEWKNTIYVFNRNALYKNLPVV